MNEHTNIPISMGNYSLVQAAQPGDKFRDGSHNIYMVVERDKGGSTVKLLLKIRGGVKSHSSGACDYKVVGDMLHPSGPTTELVPVDVLMTVVPASSPIYRKGRDA